MYIQAHHYFYPTKGLDKMISLDVRTVCAVHKIITTPEDGTVQTSFVDQMVPNIRVRESEEQLLL